MVSSLIDGIFAEIIHGAYKVDSPLQSAGQLQRGKGWVPVTIRKPLDLTIPFPVSLEVVDAEILGYDMIELLAAASEHGMEASHGTSPVLQTLGMSIVAGVTLVIASRRLGVSAIVLLLFGGIFLGPEVLNIVRPNELGDTLSPIINLAVALILFEGGLTLDLHGYRSASTVIKRLLTVGILVTWFGTAALIYFLFGYLFPDQPIAFAMLAASLVIVTGPTVIAPLLRRIRINEQLHSILHWEGVLIDPIGVFIAVLMFEFITGLGAGTAVGGFFQRIAAGLIIGTLAGFACDFILRRRWIPDDLLNIFIIAVAILVFSFDDYLVPESGLLGVTVAGLILGWRRPGPLESIKEFKAEITDLLIGTLFILLAAKLQFSDFQKFGWAGLVLVLAVVFAIRPISIFLCTFGTNLNFKERLFLSYIAPRGIVAASMASLFALSLANADTPNSWFLVTFTFSVIGFTVILQGSTAGLLAKLLGLKLPDPDGWLIVGAHPFARKVATFIRDRAGVSVTLLDSNRRSVQEAVKEGFAAFSEDAREDSVMKSDKYINVGNVLALTDNEELNVLICQRWKTIVGREHTFRWAPQRAGTIDDEEVMGTVVWKDLPKPTLVAAEIARHEVDLVVTESISKVPDLGAPLVYIRNKEIVLSPKKGTEFEDDKGGMLTLRREADYLQRSLRPDLIARLEDIHSREELFEALVSRVTSVEPRIDQSEIIAELIEREKSFSTALGHGVAVPHAYSRHLDRRLCVVAQIPEGIDFDAVDNQPVHLVFMLLSPKGDPEGHLATMGEIARLISDEQNRQRLFNAPEPADVVALIEMMRHG